MCSYMLLVYRDIIVEREGRIASEIVIAAGQGQGIGVTCDHASRHLHPRIVGIASSRQNGPGRSSRVVLECRCRPVKLYSIWTIHQIPEAQSSCATGSRERLLDRTGV